MVSLAAADSSENNCPLGAQYANDVKLYRFMRGQIQPAPLYLHVWTNLHTPVNFFFSISSLLLDFCCQLTSWLSHRENSHHSRWQVHPRLSPFSLTGGRYNMTRKKKKCTEFESQLMDLFLLNCGIVSGMWGISEVTQNLSGSFKLF